MKHLIHMGAFQGVWFACVIGASRGLWWPGVLAAALLVVGSLWGSTSRRHELRLVLLAACLGALLDSLLASASILAFSAPAPLWPERLAPPWIVALWAGFATLAPRSLSWLRPRPLLASLLGGVAGPLTYLSAARLGAAEVLAPTWAASMAVALEYALAMPLLLCWLSTPGDLAEGADGPLPSDLVLDDG